MDPTTKAPDFCITMLTDSRAHELFPSQHDVAWQEGNAPGPHMPMPPTTCDRCGQGPTQGQKLSRCSSCHSAWYCTAACQQAAWPNHKVECKKAVCFDVYAAAPLLAGLAFMPARMTTSEPEILFYQVVRKELVKDRHLHLHLGQRSRIPAAGAGAFDATKGRQRSLAVSSEALFNMVWLRRAMHVWLRRAMHVWLRRATCHLAGVPAWRCKPTAPGTPAAGIDTATSLRPGGRSLGLPSCTRQQWRCGLPRCVNCAVLACAACRP